MKAIIKSPCFQSILSLQHLLYVWLVEVAAMKDVWKFFSMVNGALSVMIDGT